MNSRFCQVASFRLRRLVSLLLYLTLYACVTPYQPEIKSLPEKRLIVDGYVTNQPGPHQVNLSYSADYTSDAANFRVEQATVYLTDSTGKRQELPESSPGTYRTPASFSGVTGQQYKLNISLANGRRYESLPERIRAAPPIISVYDEYDQKILPGTAVLRKFFDVYLDTKDPATPGDYYRWTWTHFEPVSFCSIGAIVTNGIRNEYGYYCCDLCWDVRACLEF